MAQFCPQCGAQIVPGQPFCPVCGANVAPQQPPQYQQAPPQYQQVPPQQPQYQQPQYQQPQYQQPQYQQYQQAPQYPQYGPAPAPIKNLWALITGGTVGFFSLLTLIFAIICMTSRRGFMDLHTLIGICLFFCGAGITVFFLAQRPFNSQMSQNEKIFSMSFMISNIVAWLFVLVGMIAVKAMDVLFIFAFLFFAATAVFGILSFKDLINKTGKLTWGFLATMLTVCLWFLFSIFTFAGVIDFGLLAYVFILTSLAIGGAAALFTIHYMKEPEMRLF